MRLLYWINITRMCSDGQSSKKLDQNSTRELSQKRLFIQHRSRQTQGLKGTHNPKSRSRGVIDYLFLATIWHDDYLLPRFVQTRKAHKRRSWSFFSIFLLYYLVCILIQQALSYQLQCIKRKDQRQWHEVNPGVSFSSPKVLTPRALSVSNFRVGFLPMFTHSYPSFCERVWLSNWCDNFTVPYGSQIVSRLHVTWRTHCWTGSDLLACDVCTQISDVCASLTENMTT